MVNLNFETRVFGLWGVGQLAEMRLQRTSAAGNGWLGSIEDDAISWTDGNGKGWWAARCFVQVDVFEMSEVTWAHEVGEGGRVEAGSLGRL